MAFLTHKEAADSAQLVAKLKGVREWTCPYKLTCENADDDALECVEYLTDQGLGPGTTLRYGNTYDSTVICKQIAPTRVPNSTTHWTAVLTYAQPQFADGEDASGNQTNDPIDWRYDISTGTQNYQVPVWKAWNWDRMPKDGTSPGYIRSVDMLGPVHNSAGIVYDPPLMRNVTEVVLRVSGNAQYYDPSYQRKFCNHINSGTLYWHSEMGKYGFADVTAMPQCSVRCENIAADYRRENNINFWRYTCEFRLRERTNFSDPDHVINPQDGFLESVLDRGISRIANAGAPDGAGGTVSAGDIKVGMAEAAVIRDWQGERVPEPVLLDGHGRPLQGSDTLEAPPVYFRWRIDPFADFYYPNIPLKIFRY